MTDQETRRKLTDQLYRMIVPHVHPDTCSKFSADRCHELMVRANEARERTDPEALQRILNEILGNGGSSQPGSSSKNGDRHSGKSSSECDHAGCSNPFSHRCASCGQVFCFRHISNDAAYLFTGSNWTWQNVGWICVDCRERLAQDSRAREAQHLAEQARAAAELQRKKTEEEERQKQLDLLLEKNRQAVWAEQANRRKRLLICSLIGSLLGLIFTLATATVKLPWSDRFFIWPYRFRDQFETFSTKQWLGLLAGVVILAALFVIAGSKKYEERTGIVLSFLTCVLGAVALYFSLHTSRYGSNPWKLVFLLVPLVLWIPAMACIDSSDGVGWFQRMPLAFAGALAAWEAYWIPVTDTKQIRGIVIGLAIVVTVWAVCQIDRMAGADDKTGVLLAKLGSIWGLQVFAILVRLVKSQ